METLLSAIPVQFSDFVSVTIFALLIGLSQRKSHNEQDESKLIGTDRTFTFIGILGYVLLLCQPIEKMLYIGGGLVVSAFFVSFYLQKMKDRNSYGITSLLIGLITYTLPLLVQTQPLWFTILVVVTVLVFNELKTSFENFSKRFDREDLFTFAKFLTMAGVILPIVPDVPLVSYLSITPYKIWIAVLAISSISYISYILRKFVFPNKEIWITGLLGGLYSSTATTFVLSRQMKKAKGNETEYVGAILLSISMMYLRILFLVWIFNLSLFRLLLIPMLILIALSLAIAICVLLLAKGKKNSIMQIWTNPGNPLEFKIALLFTFLYIAFTFATHFTIQKFGQNGISALSLVVGVTDIDPFLLNLFQGKYPMAQIVIATAALQAMASNNFIKMLYALTLGKLAQWKYIAGGFTMLVVANLLVVLFLN